MNVEPSAPGVARAGHVLNGVCGLQPKFGHEKINLDTTIAKQYVRRSVRNIGQRDVDHRHSTQSQSQHSHSAVTVTTSQHETSGSVLCATQHDGDGVGESERAKKCGSK